MRLNYLQNCILAGIFLSAKYSIAIGAVMVLLLAVAGILILLGVSDIMGLPILSAGDFAGGYLAAGNFATGVFSAGMFAAGIFQQAFSRSYFLCRSVQHWSILY